MKRKVIIANSQFFFLNKIDYYIVQYIGTLLKQSCNVTLSTNLHKLLNKINVISNFI